MENTNQHKLFNLFLPLVPLTLKDVDEALPYFKFKKYESNEVLFSAGDITLDVHFMLNGVGRYFYIDNDGNERNKSLVRRGGAFASISSVIEDSPSPFFAQALSDCSVAAIRYEDFVSLSKQNSSWGEILRKIFERLVLKKEKREAAFLLLPAKARYEQFLEEFGQDSHNIPLRQVAMYLGITDVSLSRIRREMGLT